MVAISKVPEIRPPVDTFGHLPFREEAWIALTLCGRLRQHASLETRVWQFASVPCSMREMIA